MAVIDDLNTAKAGYAARLAEISASPKPTYGLDGKNVSWTEYQKFLTDQIAAITKLINAEAPYEVRSQGR